MIDFRPEHRDEGGEGGGGDNNEGGDDDHEENGEHDDHEQPDPKTFRHNATLNDAGYRVEWEEDKKASAPGNLTVKFRICTPDAGWIGLGLNPTAKTMLGADMYIAYKDAEGNWTVEARVSVLEYETPSLKPGIKCDAFFLL